MKKGCCNLNLEVEISPNLKNLSNLSQLFDSRQVFSKEEESS